MKKEFLEKLIIKRCNNELQRLCQQLGQVSQSFQVIKDFKSEFFFIFYFFCVCVGGVVLEKFNPNKGTF